MWRIKIFDKDMNELTHMFVGADVRGLDYEKKINSPGSASFTTQILNSKATAANLAMFNRVKIYDGDTVRWFGYIASLDVDLNEVQVNCIGMLGFLKKRIYSSGYIPTSTVDAFVSAMLTSINSADDTGIALGTNSVTHAVNATEFSRQTGYDVLNRLAAIAGTAEFEVDDDGNLNFVETLGTDVSASVIFRYDVNAINRATIYEFQVEVDSDDLANHIIGVGTSPASSDTEDDATSQTAYGRIDKSVNFTETANATTLADATQGYLDQHKYETYSPKITPNIELIDVNSFEVGDTVGLYMNYGFINLDQDQRITRKKITVSDSGVVKADVNVTAVGVNKLPSTFVDAIIDLQARMRLYEGTL